MNIKHRPECPTQNFLSPGWVTRCDGKCGTDKERLILQAEREIEIAQHGVDQARRDLAYETERWDAARKKLRKAHAM